MKAGAEKRLNKLNPAYAFMLNNLSVYHYSRGVYDKASQLMKQALEIQQSQSSPDPQILGKVYNNLGIFSRKKGDYAEAIRYYQFALMEKLKLFCPDPASIANSYHAIGVAFKEAHQIDSALSQFERCLIYLPAEKSNLRLFTACHRNMATCYIDQAAYPEAEKHLQLCLKQPLSKDLLANTYLGLAKLKEALGEDTEAISYFEQALNLKKELFPDLLFHPEVAAIYAQIGNIRSKNEAWKKALDVYHQALCKLGRKSLGEDMLSLPPLDQMVDPHALPILVARGKALTEIYQNEKNEAYQLAALENYQVAAHLIDSLRNTYRQADSKLLLMADAWPIYERGIDLHINLYEQTGEEKYLETAFAFSERSKAILLYESLHTSRALQGEGLPDSLAEREQDLSADIRFLEKQLTRERRQGKRKNIEKVERLEKRVFLLRNKYQDFLDQLEADFPSYHHLKYGSEFPQLSEIQAKLGKKEVALGYFQGEKDLFSFVLTPKTIKAIRLDKATVDSLVFPILTFLYEKKNSPEAASLFIHQLEKLSAMLLEPLQNYDEIENVFVVPSGLLSLLPFEILLSEVAEKGREIDAENLPDVWRSLPYLLKRFNIKYDYSLNLQADLAKLNKVRPASPFAAFAPAYSAALTLPYNQEEVNELHKLMMGKAFYKADANQVTFQDEAAKHRILHLALHAKADLNEPSQSYLLFDNSNSKDELAELYAPQIYNLSIPADLVVLSACESGVGKWARGEGVMSLAHAFRYAGASSVAMSLWQVDGYATSYIIQNFYTQLLQGDRKSEALSHAKKTYLESCEPTFTHPYYWATFVLIGDDEPILKKNTPWFWLTGAGCLLILFLILWKQRKT